MISTLASMQPLLGYRPGVWGVVAIVLGVALAVYAGYYLLFKLGK